MLKLRTIFGFFKNTLDWTVLIVCILIWWVSSEWFSLKWEQRGEHHPWYHLEWYPTNFGAKESTNTQPNFEHLFAYTRPTLVMTMLILSFAFKMALVEISLQFHRDIYKNRQCSGRLFDRCKNNWDPWFIYNCGLLTIVSSLSWVWPVLVAKFGLMKMFKFDLGYLWYLEENQNNWRFMVYTRI